MSNTYKHLETLSVHAGTEPDPTTGARITPIHQNASYVFKDTKHASNLFHLEEDGFSYSRLTNPTVNTLAAKLAALDGGVGAACTSSGLAAQLLAFSALMDAGDHIVASNRLYGGSYSQLANTFPQTFGWTTTFADYSKPEEFKAALQENTKLIFIETLANPGGFVLDLEAIAKIADEAGVPLIADNTMATPYLCRPFDYGATMTTYSTTKFLSGHGNAMGGAVVDSGNFDWGKAGDKYPKLTTPQPGYGGSSFFEGFGKMAYTMHSYATGLRDLGMCQQPMNAWLTITGLETLPLRMQRHSENAQAVAEYLEGHDQVSWVSYAGLKSNKHHNLAQKYMRGSGGAVFTFGLKGGYDAGVALVENLKLFSHLANIGDTRSLVIHPASTTHSQMSSEARTAGGVGDDVVRVSIGIEHIDDIIADLEQGLAKTVAKAA